MVTLSNRSFYTCFNLYSLNCPIKMNLFSLLKNRLPKPILEHYQLILNVLFLFLSTILAIDAIGLRASRLINISKSNHLTPHIVEEIEFPQNTGTTAVKFWYTPERKKNYGIKLKILKDHYVMIKSEHDIKTSILNSSGDFIPLVSFSPLYWIFQAPKNDHYLIVFKGHLKTEVTIDIPPLSKEENVIHHRAGR